MELDKVAGSGNDEYYTPRYAIEPIIKYLSNEGYHKIWCPFDKNESTYVKMLREYGFEVINTHIEYGQDFFELDIECDAIVSNPPYSKKTEVLEKLFILGKPFAMLVGVVGLFESQKRFHMFKDNDFEIMYFNKRVSFMSEYLEPEVYTKSPPFSSVYICSKILPEQTMFVKIEKPRKRK